MIMKGDKSYVRRMAVLRPLGGSSSAAASLYQLLARLLYSDFISENQEGFFFFFWLFVDFELLPEEVCGGRRLWPLRLSVESVSRLGLALAPGGIGGWGCGCMPTSF